MPYPVERIIKTKKKTKKFNILKFKNQKFELEYEYWILIILLELSLIELE